MLCRIVTYANDPEIQSAGATLSQLQMAVSGGGVVYIDAAFFFYVACNRQQQYKLNIKILIMAVENRLPPLLLVTLEPLC